MIQKVFSFYVWRNKITNGRYIGRTTNLDSRYKEFLRFYSPYAGKKINTARKKYPSIKYWEFSIISVKRISGPSEKLIIEAADRIEDRLILEYGGFSLTIGYNSLVNTTKDILI